MSKINNNILTKAPHYFKSEMDMHAGTDFTPIFIRPEDELDVIVISDRTPSNDPVTTPSSYSVDSGSGQSPGSVSDYKYYMRLAELFEQIETEPTPNPAFVSYVGSIINSQQSHH